MNFHRLLFCLAVLLCSTLDAASASGNANLAVHDQELGSDTLTKKRLRDSVAKEDDDEERGFTDIQNWFRRLFGSSAAKAAYDLRKMEKTKQALQPQLESTKALGKLDIDKHKEDVEEMLKSSSFMRALKTNPEALIQDLVKKFDLGNAEEIIFIGIRSKHKKIKKHSEKLKTMLFEFLFKNKQEPTRHTEVINPDYSQWLRDKGKGTIEISPLHDRL